MTDLHSLTKDPSLKRYFKFMLTNRKMSVQFTSRKIREIIETDLGIPLQPPQTLYARVCIEAFAYYMQSWPEWNVAINSQYSDTLYECLITYLRNKLLYLKQREQAFHLASLEKNIVTLPRPENIPIVVQRGQKKIKAPYCLKVNIPQYLWNSTKVTLRNYGTHQIYLEFGKYAPIVHELGVKELLNYPFVSAELSIPGLIKFSRSSPFKIERFLQTLADDPVQTDSNHIISVVESNIYSPHKVYTYQLMTALFNVLKGALDKYKTELNEQIITQITEFCEEFLLDIFESNMKNTTVCEGSTVTYNIGKSTYYIDSELNTHNSLNEQLVFKKLITPIISYSLISCNITQDHCLVDGNFNFFNFPNNTEHFFIYRLKTCIKYKCLICDVYYGLNDMIAHLKVDHPTNKKIKCIKCHKRYTVGKMFAKRWKHECPVLQNNNK